MICSELAWLSNLVYEDWDEVRTQLTSAYYELLRTFDCRGSEAMLVRTPLTKMYVIVFRGTEFSSLKFSDIFHNFGRPVPWMGAGKVHSGYYTHFAEVYLEVRMFAEAAIPEHPLWVTGHSLGGALAGMYASWVGGLSQTPDGLYMGAAGANKGHRLAGLATFGAPLCMDAEAGSTIRLLSNENNWRFVVPYDFAPSWPPSFAAAGGRHVGRRIKLKPQHWWPGPVSRHSASGYVWSTRQLEHDQ